MLDHVVVDVSDDLLLRRAPVYALFRAGDLHHLLYDLMQQLPLHGVGRTVIDLLAVTPAFEKPVLGERAQMVRYGGAGHVEHRGNVDDALLPVAEQPENAHARRIAERAEQLRHGGKARVVGKDAANLLLVLVRAVVVGERKLRHGDSPFRKFRLPIWKQNVQTGCFFGTKPVYCAYND